MISLPGLRMLWGVFSGLSKRGVSPLQVMRGVFHPAVGENWCLLLDSSGYRESGYEEAALACSALGGGFRLPRADDLDRLRPPLGGPLDRTFWLEHDASQPATRGAGEGNAFGYWRKGGTTYRQGDTEPYRFQPLRSDAPLHLVLCYRE